MNYDYFLCMNHSQIVDEDNMAEHSVCNKLGEKFVVKSQKKKLSHGLISKSVVNMAKEKINIERYKKRQQTLKKKKVLAQRRFEKQIPDRSVIVNLSVLKLERLS